MCNDYEQHIEWKAFQNEIRRLELDLPSGQCELELKGADDVKVGDIGPVVRATGNGVELAQMTFGFPPPRPKRPRTFNFISEKRDFSDSKRCGIPASAFFEFTGVHYPKAKHRFALAEEPFLFVAGLWREGKDGVGDSFTMLTTTPGPDIAPFHDRQIVILRPADLSHWLYLTKPQSDLLRPLPEGSLIHEQVRAGSDKAA